MKTLNQIREELKVGEKEGDDVEFKKTTGGKPSQPEKKKSVKINNIKGKEKKTKPLGFYMGKSSARGKTATGSKPHEIDCEPKIETPEDKAGSKADKKKK
jgi:hypothetical protein